ncbi:hypothetical protein DYB37_012955 [Aphanomyces astaci]|uniref:Uncharacterized protein n=1 Tax=Aphanomyces astaci TaxID=112090 RepID=A0A3R6X970_APHAT|nr:hypothetical protein DYB35_013689 [Aphanomyces astaci]RHZ33179.1 hypothetical protein DYB37_012955 [Aphanomyces astaci]
MDAFRGELQKRRPKSRIDAQNAKRAVCDVSYESFAPFVKKPTKSYFNQLNVSLIDPAVTVTEIWRMRERDFGESSAASVIGLLTKFVGTLTSDYRHVGDHFKAMSALRNRINTQSVKCFGEPIVSEKLAEKSGPAKVAAGRSTRSEVAVGQVEVATPSGERTATDMEETAASLDNLTMQLEYAVRLT